MSEANDQHCKCRNLLADQETWHIILDPTFCNDPGAATSLAHLLFVLKKAIASGPEGSMKVINTLQDGIRMIWPYTEEHKLARELYEIYLSGDLMPWDEPRQLLEGALERFNAKRRAKSPTGTGQRPKQRRRTAAHGRS
ncbi:MAG TPA: hypothetical protein VKC61_25000 [Pyrinomonadaceae bacterium]|nr:hypothetical protein [Pyrinomonadaceae bacterium]